MRRVILLDPRTRWAVWKRLVRGVCAASLRFILPGCRSNTFINPCSVCYVKLVIATKETVYCIYLHCICCVCWTCTFAQIALPWLCHSFSLESRSLYHSSLYYLKKKNGKLFGLFSTNHLFLFAHLSRRGYVFNVCAFVLLYNVCNSQQTVTAAMHDKYRIYDSVFGIGGNSGERSSVACSRGPLFLPAVLFLMCNNEITSGTKKTHHCWLLFRLQRDKS